MDARTTPPAARVPVLLGLGVFAAYLLLCWAFALGKARPAWAEAVPDVWWLGGWQMFTLTDRENELLRAEARVDGAWVPLELETLFPTRWESGLRFDRSSFWRNKGTMRVLAEATCGRHPQHPDRVRFHAVAWRKRLGRAPLPVPADAKRTDLLEWACGRPVPQPRGRRL